ncbi:uncharacterized protein DFL_007633 [Arthrobotrys flagrans]|uniref:Uncharacterized protein n=1 Tax=Arthrobotrys flagrans TaxID=97331 RepID=A0A436ZW80_ARTFL|nr:hypothetical protein DFL_007633 [Arthrobotrys flagrans]
MSLLDHDIPSAGHTCSRCRVVFGQGTSRARHVHERDRGPYNDGPRKITVFINPSKRAYVTPFRRVQTLNRLLEYIGTLPHPQIQFVANANRTRPSFRAFEELLLSGQWQLVDSSGCIIRPDDYEELIHDGMEITIDTLPDEQQDEPIPLLQPMAVSGGKSIRGSEPQLGRNEVAGDLLDMQINEPIAQQHLGFEAKQHSHTQSEVSIVQFTPANPFVSSFEKTVDTNELEGEENLEPQILPSTPFNLPPKFGSWSGKFKSAAMSASAAEFRPSSEVKCSTTAAEFKPSNETKFFSTLAAEIKPSSEIRFSTSAAELKPSSDVQLPTSSDENTLFQLPQGTVKRSMAIPIVKPPSPALAMIAAPKPGIPMSSHDDEGSDDGWGGGAVATLEPEETPVGEESVVVEDKEWPGHTEEAESRMDNEVSRDTVETKEQGLQLSPPSEDVETTSISETIVGSGPTYGKSQIYSGRSTPNPTDGEAQYANMSPRKDSVSEDEFDNESNLLKSEILEPKDGVTESLEPTVVKEEHTGTPIGEPEEPKENEKGRNIEVVEEKSLESVPATKSSSAEMLAVLMSSVEFRPAGDTEFHTINDDFNWDMETAVPLTEEPALSQNLDPTVDSWDTTSPAGDFQATSGGSGWGDWSTSQSAVVDDTQWDNRGHVRRDSEEDAEWGPPKPKQLEHVDTPKPAKPEWAQVAAAGLAGQQSAAEPSPYFILATSPRPTETPTVKKETTSSNPVASPMSFPPRPGSSHRNSIVSPKQKRGAAPCKFIYFVPSSNCTIPNATNSNKISLVQSTAIRKLAILYAKHFKDNRLLSRANSNQNHLLELSVSRSENGLVTKHKVDLESKLMEYDFPNEFWVSVSYLGPQGNVQRPDYL